MGLGIAPPSVWMTNDGPSVFMGAGQNSAGGPRRADESSTINRLPSFSAYALVLTPYCMYLLHMPRRASRELQ